MSFDKFTSPGYTGESFKPECGERPLPDRHVTPGKTEKRPPGCDLGGFAQFACFPKHQKWSMSLC